MVVAEVVAKTPRLKKLARAAVKLRAANAKAMVWVVNMAWHRPWVLLNRSRLTGPNSIAARLGELANDLTPRKLYARALMIIITPIILLESVVAYLVMDTYVGDVTTSLSAATARDVAALIKVYKEFPADKNNTRLIELADTMGLQLFVVRGGSLPSIKRDKPFLELLHPALSKQIRINTSRKYPFYIDTVGRSDFVEIQVKVDTDVLKFIAKRSQTYVSNWYIVLIWMVGTAIILLTVAILFLGNQIKPILRLSEAAEAFGKGQPVPDFRPRGAQEVRQAAQAFIEMRDRISTHVEQRTTMLAGVSHDLRTILTRFKLQLALLKNRPEAEALNADVKEMQHMLEDYLAFSKGDGGEQAAPTNMRELLKEICAEAYQFDSPIDLHMKKRRRDLVLTIKRQAFKRALTNLISNAARFGDNITITATTDKRWFRVAVEDDGPGIAPKDREDVFKPFYRLDHARNQDEGNTGLGLSIAHDIARSHGGNIELDASPTLGGLRAIIRLPR